MKTYAMFAAAAVVDGQTTLVIVGIVVALAMLAALALYTSKKRAEALQKAATEMGMSFEKKGAAFLTELNKNLHLLTLGSFRKAKNVMRGSAPAGDIALFEYHYTEGGGQQQKTHYQTVAAFRFPDVPLPDFNLGAEHWWHKVGKALGIKAIEFSTHPEFGKRYRLQGKNEDAVRQFFRSSLLDYLQSLAEKPVWSVEAAAPWVLVYFPGRLSKPDQLRAFRDSATAVASNVVAGAGARRAAGF
jgi:hypothetical protein